MTSRAPVRLPRWLEQLLDLAHVDWEPPSRQPAARRVVLATALAVVGSLVVDAVLVAIGTHVFPSTRGFVHFRFADYGSLTVVGVLAACAGWPIVTRVTSTPRWLFFRMAIAVTVVLVVPDAWILLHGEQAEAVAVLVAMHLAIALVTYNCLVYVAPAGRRRQAGTGRVAGPLADPALAQVPVTAGAAHASAGPRVAATALPEADPSAPRRVARPPASLAEPRSAVRVLPPRPKAGPPDERSQD